MAGFRITSGARHSVRANGSSVSQPGGHGTARSAGFFSSADAANFRRAEIKNPRSFCPSADAAGCPVAHFAALFLCGPCIANVRFVVFLRRFFDPPRRDAARIFNLPYRRIAFGRASDFAGPPGSATTSGLQIRDTAESNSALLWLRRKISARHLTFDSFPENICYPQTTLTRFRYHSTVLSHACGRGILHSRRRGKGGRHFLSCFVTVRV